MAAKSFPRMSFVLPLNHVLIASRRAPIAGVIKYDAMAQDRVLGASKRGLPQINVWMDVIPVGGPVFGAKMANRVSDAEKCSLNVWKRLYITPVDLNLPLQQLQKQRAPMDLNARNLHVQAVAGTTRRRDKIRCDGVRPCASCVRKGLDCVERACKDCSREGKASECVHRKAPAPATSEPPPAREDTQVNREDFQSSEFALHQPAQRLHLPPISHPPYPLPPQHSIYGTNGHMDHLSPPPSQYYYQATMIGPGQPPQPLPPYVQQPPSDQRVGYYPAIDPNIDSMTGPSSSFHNFRQHENQQAGPSTASIG
ncbi:hypothetical protein H0H93_010379 [Arthromyces matolae]|nr:hypothetical protein H0H93_010379 [Arthromyces matolae]